MIAEKKARDPGPRRIDWDEYSRLCQMLAKKIVEFHEPETVVGIAHGGVIVGATIAALIGRDFFPIKFSRRVNAKVVRKTSKLLVPPTADLAGKSILLVDDAVRTGETIKAAIKAIQAKHAREIVTAVLIQAGSYETDFAASYFAGQVIMPWQMEEQGDDK
jgi:uncharacterized protein